MAIVVSPLHQASDEIALSVGQMATNTVSVVSVSVANKVAYNPNCAVFGTVISGYTSGYVVGPCFCPSAGILNVVFANPTGGNITPGSITLRTVVL